MHPIEQVTPRGQRFVAAPFFLGCLLAGAPSIAGAEPYIPADDEVVLETLRRPQGASWDGIRALRAALDENPQDLAAATRLARLYSELNADTGEPRYLGYAEAALEPWWEQSEPPREAWLLRARLEQRLHRFDAAQTDLEALLRTHPDDAQAALLLSTVAIVRGDYAAARSACDGLKFSAGPLVAAACVANLAPYLGEAERGLQALEALLERNVLPVSGLGVWLLTLGAELAVGIGQTETAGEYYRRALTMTDQIDEVDLYLLGSFADYLTEQDRPGEAVQLLETMPPADSLLIRLAIALAALDPAAAQPLEETLWQRMEALQSRGDDTHAREQAWFYLHVRHDAETALQHAQRNWQLQHEMRDARLLLEAAIAAGQPAAAGPVLEWMDAQQIDHAWLNDLARTLRKPQA